MKKQLFILSVISILAMSSIFTACEKDDEVLLPDRPTITTTQILQVVAINSTKEISFGVDIPGGFASAILTPYGGTFAVPGLMSIEVGATTGSITGVFTAGDVPGFGQVTLTVTDQNGKYDTGSINFQITE